jgi:hypothetical protein
LTNQTSYSNIINIGYMRLPEIHVTKAGVVKGVAAGAGGGLLLEGLVAGCASPATTPKPTSIETAHQTPITIVSPSAMPSETAYQSQIASPSPFQSLGEASTATAFALPKVDSIINPSPSEKPQTPITPQQLKDAVAALEAVPNSGLQPSDIEQLNLQLGYVTDSATKPNVRLQAEQGLLVQAYTEAKTLTNPAAQQAAYKVAFDTYWEAIAANPSAKQAMDMVLLGVFK